MTLDKPKTETLAYLFYSIIVYLIYTILYFTYHYKYKNIASTFQNQFISFFIYFSLLIISEGIINIILEKSLCESSQRYRAINVTFVSWVVCFGFVHIISYFLKNKFNILSINEKYNKVLPISIIIIGVLISILSYFYIVHAKCFTSVEDLQKQYTNYLDKLNTNAVANGSSQRGYK